MLDGNDSINWCFLAEGRHHAIFQYTGYSPSYYGKVLRIEKIISECDGGRKRNSKKSSDELSYCSNVIEPWISTKYTIGMKKVEVTKEFILGLHKSIINMDRRNEPIDLSQRVVYMLNNLSDICRSIPKSYFKLPSRSSICIELKVKNGFTSCSPFWTENSDMKYTFNKFQYMQFVKMWDSKDGSKLPWGGAFDAISSYNPFSLCSREKSKVIEALGALLNNPQNNLKVSQNGRHVFGLKLTDRTSLESHCKALLQSSENVANSTVGDESSVLPLVPQEEDSMKDSTCYTEQLLSAVAEIMCTESVLERLQYLQALDVMDIAGMTCIYNRSMRLLSQQRNCPCLNGRGDAYGTGNVSMIKDVKKCQYERNDDSEDQLAGEMGCDDCHEALMDMLRDCLCESLCPEEGFADVSHRRLSDVKAAGGLSVSPVAVTEHGICASATGSACTSTFCTGCYHCKCSTEYRGEAMSDAYDCPSQLHHALHHTHQPQPSDDCTTESYQRIMSAEEREIFTLRLSSPSMSSSPSSQITINSEEPSLDTDDLCSASSTTLSTLTTNVHSAIHDTHHSSRDTHQCNTQHDHKSSSGMCVEVLKQLYDLRITENTANDERVRSRESARQLINQQPLSCCVQLLKVWLTALAASDASVLVSIAAVHPSADHPDSISRVTSKHDEVPCTECYSGIDGSHGIGSGVGSNNMVVATIVREQTEESSGIIAIYPPLREYDTHTSSVTSKENSPHCFSTDDVNASRCTHLVYEVSVIDVGPKSLNKIRGKIRSEAATSLHARGGKELSKLSVS